MISPFSKQSLNHFPAFSGRRRNRATFRRFLARSEASEWRPSRVAPSSPSWSERWLSKRPRIRTRSLAEKTWDTKLPVLEGFFIPVKSTYTYHTYHLGLAGWFLRKILFALGNRCLGNPRILKINGNKVHVTWGRPQAGWTSRRDGRCFGLGIDWGNPKIALSQLGVLLFIDFYPDKLYVAIFGAAPNSWPQSWLVHYHVKNGPVDLVHLNPYTHHKPEKKSRGPYQLSWQNRGSTCFWDAFTSPNSETSEFHGQTSRWRRSRRRPMPWLPALRRQRRIPIGPTIPLWILRHRAMLHYRERDPMSVPFPNNDRLFARQGQGQVLCCSLAAQRTCCAALKRTKLGANEEKRTLPPTKMDEHVGSPKWSCLIFGDQEPPRIFANEFHQIHWSIFRSNI